MYILLDLPTSNELSPKLSLQQSPTRHAGTRVISAASIPGFLTARPDDLLFAFTPNRSQLLEGESPIFSFSSKWLSNEILRVMIHEEGRIKITNPITKQTYWLQEHNQMSTEQINQALLSMHDLTLINDGSDPIGFAIILKLPVELASHNQSKLPEPISF